MTLYIQLLFQDINNSEQQRINNQDIKIEEQYANTTIRFNGTSVTNMSEFRYKNSTLSLTSARTWLSDKYNKAGLELKSCVSTTHSPYVRNAQKVLV